MLAIQKYQKLVLPRISTSSLASNLPAIHSYKVNSICEFWKNFAEDLSQSEQINNKAETVYERLMAGAVTEYVVGDVHGDLNHFLYNILASKAAVISDPSLVLYDTMEMRRMAEGEEMQGDNDLKNWQRYRLIPNLKFNPEFREQLVFLGDILDRGIFCDECLFAFADLCAQEKEARESNPDQKKSIHCVFADHEIYGLYDDYLFFPSYRLIAEELKRPTVIVQEALRHMIENEFITYSHIGNNGVFYSHSFFTKEFLRSTLKDCEAPIESFPETRFVKIGKNEEELEKIKSALKFFIRFESSEFDDEYYQNLTTLSDYLNEALKFAVENKIYEAAHINVRGGDANLPPFLRIDKESPIFSRICENVIPLKAAIGHTNRPDHKVTRADQFVIKTFGEEKFLVEGEKGRNIYLFDVEASYWYHQERSKKTTASESFASHPRFCQINPDGSIEFSFFARENEIFAEGVNNKFFEDKVAGKVPEPYFDELESDSQKTEDLELGVAFEDIFAEEESEEESSPPSPIPVLRRANAVHEDFEVAATHNLEESPPSSPDLEQVLTRTKRSHYFSSLQDQDSKKSRGDRSPE